MCAYGGWSQGGQGMRFPDIAPWNERPKLKHYDAASGRLTPEMVLDKRVCASRSNMRNEDWIQSALVSKGVMPGRGKRGHSRDSQLFVFSFSLAFISGNSDKCYCLLGVPLFRINFLYPPTTGSPRMWKRSSMGLFSSSCEDRNIP